MSLGDIEYFCPNIRHVLTHLLQSGSFCSHIIEVWSQLWSAFQSVGYWDMALVFKAKVQLSQPSISWLMIEVLAQLISAIQSRMRFFDLYEANFDKLRLMIDVWFQPRHASRVPNAPLKSMYLSLLCTLYFRFLHSHHVFFNLESVDAVHIDSHLSRHFTMRCRQLITFGLCKYVNPCLIGIWRLPLKCPELSAPCQLVRWRMVAPYNETSNAQTWPFSNLS